MKYILGFLSGFVLTLIVFVSGAAVTVVYLSAEPVPVRQLSMASSEIPASDDIRVVDRSSSTLVSQAGPDTSGTASQATQAHNSEFESEQALDFTMTAATGTEAAPDLISAHVAWCSERYRSYDPDNNSYNAYSGEQRECVSPFFEIMDRRDSPEQVGSVTNASAEGSSIVEDEAFASVTQSGYVDPDHVQSCFARYRSYRPEDNTYQPYGGGPRQQCR